MGRRALPKIDPTLDLSWHFASLDEIAQPLDPAVLFPRSAPLEIEIGSGKGMFLSAAAAAEPEKNFVGIEIAERYARYAASRLAKRRLTNARMLCGDGQRLLRDYVGSGTLAAVHVYFPDPWWKARHRRRRVLNEDSLQQIERVLLPGGRLHVWTDVEEYYLGTLELIRLFTKLAGPFDVPERPAETEIDYHTNFERRSRMHGRPVYRAEFRRG